MLLGLSRKKLGDIVFTRRNGKQVQRVRVIPKNPKTDAQCKQRMFFATATTAASQLKAIVNHSFQGVKAGNDSINQFVARNVKKLRASYLADASVADGYLIKGAQAIANFPFVISSGSVANKLRASETLLVNDDYFALSTGVKFADYDPDVTFASAAEYEILLASLGLAPGDQLSVVHVEYSANDIVAQYGDAYNVATNVIFSRVVLRQSSEIAFGTRALELFGNPRSIDGRNAVTFNPSVIDYSRSINPENIFFASGGTNAAGEQMLEIYSPLSGGDAAMLGAVIRSQYDASNGSYKYSSESFALNEDVLGRSSLGRVVWPSYSETASTPESTRLLQQPLPNYAADTDVSPILEISSSDNVVVSGDNIILSGQGEVGPVIDAPVQGSPVAVFAGQLVEISYDGNRASGTFNNQGEVNLEFDMGDYSESGSYTFDAVITSLGYSKTYHVTFDFRKVTA